MNGAVASAYLDCEHLAGSAAGIVVCLELQVRSVSREGCPDRRGSFNIKEGVARALSTFSSVQGQVIGDGLVHVVTCPKKLQCPAVCNVREPRDVFKLVGHKGLTPQVAVVAA
jgi:hypothetical protein